MLNSKALFAGSLLATLAAVAAPGDWAQWRGPNRDDISTETGLLKEWSSQGPPLVWKATGLGKGFSTVSVADGRIFTIGDQDNASFVVALNAADGKVAWSAKLGKPGAPGWGGFEGPRSTPAMSGDVVIGIGQWGEVGCFDAATGKEKWRKDFTKDYGGTRPEWGFAESPLADGDKIVFTPGGNAGAI